MARAQFGGYSRIFHLQAVTTTVRDAPSPGTGRLRGEAEGQTQVRANHCSRRLSDRAEPQQMTGMASFAIEGKAVPRTSPITRAPQPPISSAARGLDAGFHQDIKLRSCKIAVQKPNYTYFRNSQFKLVFRSPHIPLRYIKHFLPLEM